MFNILNSSSKTNLAHLHTIPVSKLTVGLYVHLDVGWMDHPFTLSSFKIEDETQISTIKRIGIREIRYDPNRSDCKPLDLTNVVELPVKKVMITTDDKPVDSEPDLAQQRQDALKHAIDEAEKKFVQTSLAVRQIQTLSTQQPAQAIAQSEALVDELLTVALTEGDIIIHAMNGNRSSDAHYQHELNILVLAMMLCKTLNLSHEEAYMVGMAGILHDIGKKQISDKIILKREALTQSEQKILESHAELGAQLIASQGLPQRLSTVVAQHHELADGSGYPRGLHESEIDPLAQLLVVVNTYDNLCNPSNPAAAKTPYEALGFMFAHYKKWFNDDLLKRFIKCLGVYPPGSIVRLSNQTLAGVISVNPNQPLRPYVKTIALDGISNSEVIDLREATNINITQCIKASQLPSEILKSATQRQRVSYMLDKAS